MEAASSYGKVEFLWLPSTCAGPIAPKAKLQVIESAKRVVHLRWTDPQYRFGLRSLRAFEHRVKASQLLWMYYRSAKMPPIAPTNNQFYNGRPVHQSSISELLAHAVGAPITFFVTADQSHEATFLVNYARSAIMARHYQR